MTFQKSKRIFTLLLGGGVLGAVLTTPASASTLLGFTLTTDGSNTATFSSGALESISGWAPGSVTYNGMTYTITGGTTTFTKGVMDTLTISGAVPGLSRLSSVSNLLTIAWTSSAAANEADAASPNLPAPYASASYTFNPTLPTDLSDHSPAFGSATFVANQCVSGCSAPRTATPPMSGTYQANEPRGVAPAPEPASFLLIGAGLIAASIVRRKKGPRAVSIKQ